MPSWKSFRPYVQEHLEVIGHDFLHQMTAEELNDLYDGLEWDDDNEYQNKQKLTKWILTAFPEYKDPDKHVPHVALARSSMELRKKKQQAEKESKKSLGDYSQKELDAFVAAMNAPPSPVVSPTPIRRRNRAGMVKDKTPGDLIYFENEGFLSEEENTAATDNEDAAHFSDGDVFNDGPNSGSTKLEMKIPSIPYASKPGVSKATGMTRSQKVAAANAKSPTPTKDSANAKADLTAATKENTAGFATEAADFGDASTKSNRTLELLVRLQSIVEFDNAAHAATSFAEVEANMDKALSALCECTALFVFGREEVRTLARQAEAQAKAQSEAEAELARIVKQEDEDEWEDL